MELGRRKIKRWRIISDISKLFKPSLLGQTNKTSLIVIVVPIKAKANHI